MTKLIVVLNSIEKVRDFINRVSTFTDTDMDLVHGKYVVDAKSILGIFSLNLSEPLELIIHSTDNTTISNIKNSIKNYIVNI